MYDLLVELCKRHGEWSFDGKEDRRSWTRTLDARVSTSRVNRNVKKHAHRTQVKPPKQTLTAPLLSSCLLHRIQHRPGELVRSRGAAHITCSDLTSSDNVINGLADAVCVVVQAEMPQHHASGEDERSWVGLVLTSDIKTDVTASGLEDSDFAAHVAAGYDTWAADEAGTNVGQDRSVEVWHDHDVELLWSADALHAGVVDDHVIGLEGGVFFADALDGVAEEAIGKLHDVGLVDASHLAAIVRQGEAEGEFGDALRLGARDDLQRLDDAGDGLVLKTGVLALGVLTDNAQIDVLVPCLVAGDVLDQDNGGVDVEFLPQRDVERGVAGALDGRVQNALQAELVSLEGCYSLAEKLF